MKQRLYVSVLVCILLSFFALTAKAQSPQNPDTKIQGTVTEIRYDYQGQLLLGTYKITALISVRLNETLIKPETFTRERDQLVGISYNYSSPPKCRVDDFVEVYGLWISALDIPASSTIRVDKSVVGSYVELLPSSSSPPPLSGDGQSAASIDTQSEYSNGSIPIYYQDDRLVMSLWYDWINTQSTQVIFFAYHSEVYNSPIVTFVGQHYATPAGTEVFMGNTLSLMEAYNDTNGNNVPDTSETSYFFLVNSSINLVLTPIQKVVLGDIAHYRWGVKHQTVDGFLEEKNGTSGTRVIVEHMAFSYDYYIHENVSYLKSDFDLGKIVSMEASEPNLALHGLSLSLLYTTMTIIPKNYTVIVNEQPYNSTTASPSPIVANRTEVRMENQKTYEFLFGENYTLYRDSLIESFKSFSVASATSTVSSNARVSLSWLLEQLEDELEDIFPKISKMQAKINLDYAASTFVYRICYPAWEGHRIKVDPTYIAYINPQSLPHISIRPPLELLTAAIIIGSIALIAAAYELRKTRSRPFPTSIHPLKQK